MLFFSRSFNRRRTPIVPANSPVMCELDDHCSVLLDLASVELPTSRDIVGGILSAIRSKPTCYSIDINAIGAENTLLAHVETP